MLDAGLRTSLRQYVAYWPDMRCTSLQCASFACARGIRAGRMLQVKGDNK